MKETRSDARRRDLPEMLTLDQAAYYLNYSPATVRSMLRDGKLGQVKMGGKPKSRIRIPKSELDEFIKARYVRKPMAS